MRAIVCLVLLFSPFCCLAQADTGHVYFELDNAFLNSKTEKKVDAFASKIPPGAAVQIIGYADYLGDDYYNDMLAMRRAQSVAKRLRQWGIEEKNIRLVTGKGSISRIEEQAGGYPTDRRVDILVSTHTDSAEKKKVVPPVNEVKPTAPLAAKPAAVDLDEEEIRTAEVGSSLKISNLYFVGGRDIIRRESWSAVEKLFDILEANPSLKVQIEGHVCCTSDPEEDGTDLATGVRNLSAMRAKAVYDILIKKGIPASRLSYKGMAHTLPAVLDERTEAMADRNRRVEIRILEK